MSQHDTADRGSATQPTFAATVDASTLRDALAAVDAIVEECVFQVHPDGLAVVAQDPATVALVSLDLPASAFEAYEARETAIGVDLDRLGSVVGMADRDELVRLVFEAERGILHVRVGELSYTLGTIDPAAVRSPPEGADFGDQFVATTTIEGRVFVDAVGAADVLADHLAFGVDPDEERLYASAEGDVDSMQIDHPADACVEFETGDAHSLFSLSYLDAVAGVVPEDEELELQLGEEAPLGLSFELAGGTVEYVVAPRIGRS